MRRAAPTFLAAVLVVAAVVNGSVSNAQPSDASRAVALDWTAPEECPGTDYIESQIGELLAGGPAARVLRASAKVRREREGEWRVELTTETAGEVGHRALTAESCRAAADATALILALAVDPARVASNRLASASAAAPPSAAPPSPPPPPPASSSPPPPPPPREPPMVLESRPQVASTPHPPTIFEIEVGGALEMGTLPTVTPDVVLTAAVVPGFARRLRFLATGALSGTSSSDAAPPVSGSFQLRVLGFGGCYLPIAGTSELGLCADAEVDSLAGSGLGETSPRDATATWVALRPHVTVAYPFFAQWAFRFDGGVGIALDRPEFDSTGVGGGFIHRPAEASGRVSLGIELRF